MDNWEKAKSEEIDRLDINDDFNGAIPFIKGADFGRAYSQGEIDELIDHLTQELAELSHKYDALVAVMAKYENEN